MPKTHLSLASTVIVLFAGLEASSGQWLEEDCQDLVTATGTQDGNLFGDRVAGVGDVTGDGVPDFAVTAPFYNTNRGRVTVHDGTDGSEVWGRTVPAASAILGFSLAVCGDLNGDGANEVVSGAPFAPNSGGFVIVFSGVDGETLHGFDGDPAGFNASIGYSLATRGDFDGDGVDDLAIGDTGNDDEGPNAGRVSVYSTDDWSLICHVYPPADPVARFGTACRFVGDVNDDGRDDLVIGDRYIALEGPGRLHVFGHDGVGPQLVHSIEGVNMGCALCGDPVDAGRDVDGDLIGDIVIGETSPDFRARVFSGDDGTLLMSTGETVVQTAVLVDDVDGDGLADVLAGERSNDEGGLDAGKVYLFSGATGQILRTMTFTAPDSGFGTRLAGFDDLDGDGGKDFLVGARSGFGSAYVMRGPAPDLPADVNGDGLVNFQDLLEVLEAWGPCAACPEDIDGDMVVGFQDLLMVLFNWS